MNGLQARVDHHRRTNKKLHWHIDYLLANAELTGVIMAETEQMIECIVAQSLQEVFDSVPHFGSSDCHCRSHLFFDKNEKTLKSAAITSVKGKHTKVRVLRTRSAIIRP